MQRGFGTPATYCTAPATSVRDEEGFFLHHKIGMGLQAQGYQVRDEDAARSSPLGVKRTAAQAPARPGHRCRLMPWTQLALTSTVVEV